MIGNAVPPEFAKAFARKIKADLLRFGNMPLHHRKRGKLVNLNIRR